jgi:hypothetical protein
MLAARSMVRCASRHGYLRGLDNRRVGPTASACRAMDARGTRSPQIAIGMWNDVRLGDVRKKTDRRQDPFIYGSLSSEPLYFKSAAAAR